jgi:hypothetical protein
LSDLCFTVIIPSNPSASSSLYPLAFVGGWWDLRRDSLFSYLHIIHVLGVFQGFCGVRIISASTYPPLNWITGVKIFSSDNPNNSQNPKKV